MSENKHTRGPWELELDDDADVSGSTFVIRMASALEGGGYEPQHRIEYEVPSEDESPAQFSEGEANARLIIAAPDLLKALKSVIEGVDEFWMRENPGEVDAAQEAIDRAEGRA